MPCFFLRNIIFARYSGCFAEILKKKIISTVLHKIDNFPGKITLLQIF